MQSTKSFREEFDLDTINELINEQAPRLISALEAKYYFENEKRPSKMLQKYEKLTKVEKFEILGWISSASNRLINDMALGAVSYINLTTMRQIDKTINSELDEATPEEWKFFEKGYKIALRNKNK